MKNEEIKKIIRIKENNPNLALRILSGNIEYFGQPKNCMTQCNQWSFYCTVNEFIKSKNEKDESYKFKL